MNYSVGNDIRKIVDDGYPTQNIVVTDINPRKFYHYFLTISNFISPYRIVGDWTSPLRFWLSVVPCEICARGYLRRTCPLHSNDPIPLSSRYTDASEFDPLEGSYHNNHTHNGLPSFWSQSSDNTGTPHRSNTIAYSRIHNYWPANGFYEPTRDHLAGEPSLCPQSRFVGKNVV